MNLLKMAWINYTRHRCVSFLKTCSPVRLDLKRNQHVRGHFVWPCPELQPLDLVLADPSLKPDSHFTLYKSTRHHVPTPPANLAVTWTEGACSCLSRNSMWSVRREKTFFIYVAAWPQEKHKGSTARQHCQCVTVTVRDTELTAKACWVFKHLFWPVRLSQRRNHVF